MLVGALQVEVDLLARRAPACRRRPPPTTRPTRTRRRRCRGACRTRRPPQSRAGACRPAAARPAARVNQAFEPSRAKMSRHVLDNLGVEQIASRIGGLQRNAGIGTPQTRWRDRHQSGRTSIMPRMRFAAPGRDPGGALDLGQRAWRAGCSGRSASPRRANHCVGGAEDDRLLAAPAVRVLVAHRLARLVEQEAASRPARSTTFGFASNTVMPAQLRRPRRCSGRAASTGRVDRAAPRSRPTT